jgi:hypothetical protein
MVRTRTSIYPTSASPVASIGLFLRPSYQFGQPRDVGRYPPRHSVVFWLFDLGVGHARAGKQSS